CQMILWNLTEGWRHGWWSRFKREGVALLNDLQNPPVRSDGFPVEQVMANPATNWMGVRGLTRRVWSLQWGQRWAGQTSGSLFHGHVGFCVPGHAETGQHG
ncbi:hypothetical protein NDU88_004179, partial [Pleurodeles waltl]